MRVLLFFIVALMTTACNSLGMYKEVPARLINPDQASRNELQQIITSALDATDTLLSEHALTQDSKLMIERRPRHRLENSPAPGRDLSQPEIFQLILSGTNCVLVHLRDGRRWTLRHAHCKAE